MVSRKPKPFVLYAPEAQVSWLPLAVTDRDENPAALCRKKWQGLQSPVVEPPTNVQRRKRLH